jgi:phosphoribosyl-ATP pyrophosphohydrolase/phosphoribosyl-AMP cyclohydrolase
MTLDFAKGGGLIPVVVQDSGDGTVLMLGYMNEEALEATRETGFVTFYSRSKGRLWTKGETSGHRLSVVTITDDCDGDAILVIADAHGPTCHTGARSCFGDAYSFEQASSFLDLLTKVIKERKDAADGESSYTARLLAEGSKRIAQKVGEEAVEVLLESSEDASGLVAESADLLYHLMVLLESRDLTLADVVDELKRRHAGLT